LGQYSNFGREVGEDWKIAKLENWKIMENVLEDAGIPSGINGGVQEDALERLES
jgi:hypothetical protein